jgi:hypothetical protein
MSLQHAAKYLAKHGRGPDTTLVHMSKKEVKSLNDLAMAHGGHLTINPSTGLPEAGFLDKMLPAIIGGGLAIATGGTSLALTPGMIGLGIGGFEALRTGDVKKGLMAGLGAYGGAGLAGGLAAAGTGALGQEATNQAVQQATAQNLQGEAYNQAIQNQVAEKMAEASTLDKLGAGVMSPGMTMDALGGGFGAAKTVGAAITPALLDQEKPSAPQITTDNTPAPPLTYEYGAINPTPAADVPKYGDLGQDFGQERNYFQNAGYRPSTVQARGFANGGPIEAMSTANSVGANTGYPMADISKGAYATPYQQPISRNVLTGTSDTGVNPITGEMANFAAGGISHLGDYSDGGRLLRGPGDGVSDSIPAMIGKKQPARLADGEFVVPARIVSELGNGSTEAGARKLYAMMDRIQKARGKTVGKGKVAKNSRSEKYLPA